MLRPIERLAQLDAYVAGLGGSEKERGRLRIRMYQDCKNADVGENIASCDSPVGSGKTTEAMAHLLAQASKRGCGAYLWCCHLQIYFSSQSRCTAMHLSFRRESRRSGLPKLHHRADLKVRMCVTSQLCGALQLLSLPQQPFLKRLHPIRHQHYGDCTSCLAAQF